jgi:hypothetical protein
MPLAVNSIDGLQTANYSPSPRTTLYIRGLLSSITQQEETLAKQIRVLKIEQARLSRESRDLRIVVSPIRRLPWEIVAEIFAHAVYNEAGSFARVNSLEPPLLLAQICSAWRTVALSTTALWSSLSLTVVENIRPETAANLLSLVQIWNLRSGTRPLCISFSVVPRARSFSCYRAGDGLETAIPGITRLVEHLVAQSARWRRVRLQVPIALLPALLPPNLKSFPLLENLYLRLSRTHQAHVGMDWTPVVDFPPAPALRTLSLAWLPHLQPLLPIHWHQLLELDLDIGVRATTLGILEILRQCHQLRICHMVAPSRPDMAFPNFPAQSYPNSIILGCLEALEVRIVRSHPDLNGFSQAISVPRLRKLVIRSSVPFNQGIQFCHLPSSLLSHLSLFRLAVGVEELIEQLACASSLTHLTVSNWEGSCGPICDRLIKWLMPTKLTVIRQGLANPGLTHISLDGRKCSANALRNLVYSRWNLKRLASYPIRVARLEKVEIVFPCFFEGFGVFARQGLDLKVIKEIDASSTFTNL